MPPRSAQRTWHLLTPLSPDLLGAKEPVIIALVYLCIFVYALCISGDYIWHLLKGLTDLGVLRQEMAG